mgnify:CR=1 FL=1
MTDLAFFLSEFHFIRPIWLALLPIVAAVWLMVRYRATRTGIPDAGLAPHLRDALTLGARDRKLLLPIDWAAAIISLALVGAAGPAWTRVPDPFVAQTAPMVVVLKVTPSMTANDVAPTRLDRAKQKIEDLLKLRAGARTALVAYAGTTHLAVPMTNDPTVIKPYLEGLDPEIMPKDGADAFAAFETAAALLKKEQTSGAVLFVLDEIGSQDVQTLNAADDPGVAIGALEMLPEGAANGELSGLDFIHVRVTPDDADLRTLDRTLNADYRRALNQNGTQPWDDRGWVLAWPAALLALFWFRRGWTMRWLIVFLTAFTISFPERAKADVADWFFTPDQRGRLAYQDKDFKAAAEHFSDPMWKARALYRDGQYEAAAEAYERLDTPEAAFAKGLAYIRNRAYRDGIRAFEETLDLDPDFPGAAENLKTAKEILDYVETTREQSDTGEDSGIGADEVVFDNEENRGAETTIGEDGDTSGLLTTQQWMNLVDTRTGDFLRQRFAVEAAEK